jgi:hypothetical protein
MFRLPMMSGSTSKNNRYEAQNISFPASRFRLPVLKTFKKQSFSNISPVSSIKPKLNSDSSKSIHQKIQERASKVTVNTPYSQFPNHSPSSKISFSPQKHKKGSIIRHSTTRHPLHRLNTNISDWIKEGRLCKIFADVK